MKEGGKSMTTREGHEPPLLPGDSGKLKSEKKGSLPEDINPTFCQRRRGDHTGGGGAYS